MATEYSVETCKKLEAKFRNANLYRPMRVGRYDAGDEIEYKIQEVAGANQGKAHLVIDKFVGGGFAGQVYRVKVLKLEAPDGPIAGLQEGGMYAMKILIPPSGFACLFRNILYWVGFQGPFQLQVNPIAARAGALWQKFIRRGAKVVFGDERAVVDIHATFVDQNLGSCGELSEWIDGRTWRLEVDDHLDFLKAWHRGKKVDASRLGSPEYRSKYEFMRDFVGLLHSMGAHEFARQYEWATCKSQPNCLKRNDSGDDPDSGLTAVDFRAGLALLPFLPMSPGDFMLIFKGLKRGSLVQFDRGNLQKLEQFVADHKEDFTDLQPMLAELRQCEEIYRNSIPDITHNHIRLLYSRQLWSTIFSSAVESWKVRNMIDQSSKPKFQRSRILSFLFFLIGLVPFLGAIVQRIWAHADWRRHYGKMFSSPGYLLRSFRARAAEVVINWHRAGRLTEKGALKTVGSFWRFSGHLLLSWLPIGLHKLLTDWGYTKERLYYIFVRPLRLYFDARFREQWLHDMVTEGQAKRIVTPEDAQTILSQIKEPFIQKYLKSLAVHVCTLPVTQVVAVIVAVIYVMMHPEMPTAQAWAIGFGIVAIFR